MKILEVMSIILIVYAVIYMILKYITVREMHRNSIRDRNTEPKRTKVQVDITSSDLYMRAENIIEAHDILASQAYYMQKDINDLEELIKSETVSAIGDDDEVQRLVRQSVDIQYKKCRIETQMIKLIEELDKIALEEYNRKLQ